jgi:hypothetical protein
VLHATEYAEWQWPFSGVHSIVMEKLAQAGKGWGGRPPFYTLSLFLLYPFMYSVLKHPWQSERDSGDMSMSNLISSRIFLWGWVPQALPWGTETRKTK